MLLLGTLVACSTVIHGRLGEAAPAKPTSGRLGAGLPEVPSPRASAPHAIRVALMTNASTARISATGAWGVYAADGQGFVARARAGEEMRIQHNAGDVRAVRADGSPTAWKPHALVARADDASGVLLVNGKRYRGTLTLIGTAYGLEVVEATTVEDYLRGVVPLEIGDRTPGDSAAIQAQAVSARSYAYTHLADLAKTDYDLTDGVSDQVYGGVDAETAVGNAAVASTAGIVVTFGGRVVNAPYHSTCGGETAGPEEVWGGGTVPYLRPVSDLIPGTNRYYCEVSPHFRWTRTLSVADLNKSVAHYLQLYTAVPGGDPGLVRDVSITNRTQSGRVATLNVRTTTGSFTLTGDDMRYVLRTYGAAILGSTLFSLSKQMDDSGNLARLTINGRGFGHGVGMCQWGAIGRARAGQDFRTILRTYYPGTSLGVVQ